MSSIKLLILEAEANQTQIDPAELAPFAVETEFLAWEQLMSITEIAADAILFEGDRVHDHRLLLHHLQSIAPACKPIVTRPHSIVQTVSYLRHGVTCILDSRHEPRRLAEIIRRVCDGEYHLDHDIAQSLAMRQIKKLLQPFTSLNSREFDVFCLLAEGCSLQSIAEQLDVSSKTVSNCQSQIKLKLGLENRKAIADFAEKHGLIPSARL